MYLWSYNQKKNCPAKKSFPTPTLFLLRIISITFADHTDDDDAGGDDDEEG